MSFRKRWIAVTAVAAMAAALLYGSTFEPRQVQEDPLAFLDNKETIYFWYSDKELEDFVSSAAVSFGEREDVRVIPVLTSDSQYLEAINEASLHKEQVPDLYLISHEALEKAYLAGLACEIEDVSGWWRRT